MHFTLVLFLRTILSQYTEMIILRIYVIIFQVGVMLQGCKQQLGKGGVQTLPSLNFPPNFPPGSQLPSQKFPPGVQLPSQLSSRRVQGVKPSQLPSRRFITLSTSLQDDGFPRFLRVKTHVIIKGFFSPFHVQLLKGVQSID